MAAGRVRRWHTQPKQASANQCTTNTPAWHVRSMRHVWATARATTKAAVTTRWVRREAAGAGSGGNSLRCIQHASHVITQRRHRPSHTIRRVEQAQQAIRRRHIGGAKLSQLQPYAARHRTSTRPRPSPPAPHCRLPVPPSLFTLHCPIHGAGVCGVAVKLCHLVQVEQACVPGRLVRQEQGLEPRRKPGDTGNTGAITTHRSASKPAPTPAPATALATAPAQARAHTPARHSDSHGHGQRRANALCERDRIGVVAVIRGHPSRHGRRGAILSRRLERGRHVLT